MPTTRIRTSPAAAISVAAGSVAWFMAVFLYLSQINGYLTSPVYLWAPLACAIAGIVAGHKARAGLKRAGPPADGKRLATIGLVLGYGIALLIVVPLVVVLVFLVLYGGRGS